MNVSKINDQEVKFFTTLTSSSGEKFQKISEVKLNNYSIYKIKPSYSTYYYKEKTKKDMIVLHSTIGTIRGDVASLTKPDTCVSVSYVVDRTGNIYELFDPNYWSYHLGMGSVGGNAINSKRSIGIELSNYGPLILKGSNLETVYSQVSYKDNGVAKLTATDVYCSTSETNSYVKLQTPFRGYNHFASYTQAQCLALRELVDYLCKEFDIPKNYIDVPKRYQIFASDNEAKTYKGISTHINYRASGKWDLGPDFLWNVLMDEPTIETPVIEAPVEVLPEPTIDIQPTIPTVIPTPTPVTPNVTPPAPIQTKTSLIKLVLMKILELFRK